MNMKFLTGAAILAAASMSFGIETWSGADGVYLVTTDLDNGTKTAGYFYSYADDADGGKSKVNWPVATGTEYGGEDALDPVIDECQGVCGQAVLDKGKLGYDPFIGIGFNVAGTATEDGGPAEQADASSWGGVCLTYVSEAQPTLELGLGDEGDKKLAFDNPAKSLAKATSPKTVNLSWSDFEQAGWGLTQDPPGIAMTGDEASTQLASVKFKIQGKDGTKAFFNIMSVGAKDGGCEATDGMTSFSGSSSKDDEDAIFAQASASSVKAMLSGRTLSFAGVTSATAEVINLQGQVVLKGAVSASSSLNLASLDAGVYMVRVAGKAVNHSQKIVLK